jgi:hypothetical protein
MTARELERERAGHGKRGIHRLSKGDEEVKETEETARRRPFEVLIEGDPRPVGPAEPGLVRRRKPADQSDSGSRQSL